MLLVLFCFVFFFCNSVRIGQNVLNVVPAERAILADSSNYLLIWLNGNWSRKNNMAGSVWTKTTKADVKELIHLYKDFFQHSLLRRWIVLNELQLPMSHPKFHHYLGWSVNPFAPEPPVTARAAPGPFYPL